MRKLAQAFLILCVATGASTRALAADVFLFLEGEVSDVQDSPFAGGQTTNGVFIGDPVEADLLYDDATAQASGDFVSYELTDLTITVPDTTQGGSFDLVPAQLNSATRIVFDGPDFQGLLLPQNVTGFESNIDAFDLTDLSFEADGFAGPDFRFNLGTPVVEFFLPEPGAMGMLAAGTAGLALLRGRRRSRG